MISRWFWQCCGEILHAAAIRQFQCGRKDGMGSLERWESWQVRLRTCRALGRAVVVGFSKMSLDLIDKSHGHQAVRYFSNIPQILRNKKIQNS